MRLRTFVLPVALLVPGSPGEGSADAPSRYARSDGARVHYQSLGRGNEAVVFVHCWTCDTSFWREQAPAVAAKGWRVILLDLPGHGRSDKPEVSYSMDYFARAVNAVLEDAGVERAVLVGHSMGAPVVRQYYRLFPKRVRGLVVVDGTLRPWEAPRAEIDAFVGRYRGPDHREQAAQAIDGMQGPTTPPEVREHVKSVMLATPNHVRVSSLERMFFDEGVWRPDPIKVPVAAIMAESKYWEGYEAYLRTLASDVHYTVIPGAGHFVQLEKAAEVNAALLAFLGRLRPGR